MEVKEIQPEIYTKLGISEMHEMQLIIYQKLQPQIVEKEQNIFGNQELVKYSVNKAGTKAVIEKYRDFIGVNIKRDIKKAKQKKMFRPGPPISISTR